MARGEYGTDVPVSVAHNIFSSAVVSSPPGSEGSGKAADKTAVATPPRASELLAISVTIPSYTGYVECSVNRMDVVGV